MTTSVAFIIWVLVLLWTSAAVAGLLRRVGSCRWLGPALFPALLVRQLGVVLVCMVTVAKVRAVHLLPPEGPEVEHERSKLGVVGEMLIALTPLVVCGLALGGAGSVLGQEVGLKFELPRDLAPVSVDGVAIFGHRLLEIARETVPMARHNDLRSWSGLLFLYLSVALTLGMAPTRRSIGLATLGLVLFGTVVSIYDALTPGPWWGLFQYGEELIKQQLWPPISFFVAIQLATLAVALVLAGAAKLLGLYGVRPGGK